MAEEEARKKQVEEEERKQDIFLLIRLVKILNLIKMKANAFFNFYLFSDETEPD